MPNNRNSSGPSKGRRSSSPRSGSSGRSFTKKSTDKPFKKSSSDSDKKFRKSSSSDDSFSGGKKFSSSSRSSGGPFKRPSKDSDQPSSFDKRPGFSKKRNFSNDGGEQRPTRRFDDKKQSGSSFKRGGNSFDENRSSSAGPRREKPFKKFDGPRGKSTFGKDGDKPDFKKRDSFSNETPRPRKKFDSSDRPFRKDGKAPFKKRDSFAGDTPPPRKRFDSSEDRPFRKEGKPAFKKRDSFSSDTPRPRKKFDSDEGERPSPFRKTDKSGFTKGSAGKDSPRPYKKSEDQGEKRTFDKSAVRHAKSKDTPEEYSKTNESAAPAGKIRLNKFISNSGVCSRREADELIKMGLISVNGKTITELGYKVNPGDEVRHESKVLRAEKPVYILMNKPKGFLTTTVDPQERNTVMQLVAGLVKERIYPVGRLDRNTTGLLLLTNDGDLAEKLMHPSYNVKKIYKVELDKPLTKADADRILEGVRLEEGKAVVDDLAIVSDDRKTIGLEIHIGWNRVVRRIFESLEYAVVKLDRSVYAGLTKKDLARGEWRFLKKEELVLLKHYK